MSIDELCRTYIIMVVCFSFAGMFFDFFSEAEYNFAVGLWMKNCEKHEVLR